MTKKLIIIIVGLIITMLCLGVKLAHAESNYDKGPFSDIKTKYGVEVHSQISIPGREYMSSAIDEFLSEYEINFIKPNLKSIYLVEDELCRKDIDGSDIYILCNGISKKTIINQMHYEFSKVIFKRYAKYIDTEWKRIYHYIPSHYHNKSWKRATPDRSEKILKYGFLKALDIDNMEPDFFRIVHLMFTQPQEFNRLANAYPKIADRRELVTFLYDQIVTGLDINKLLGTRKSHNNTTPSSSESELVKGVKIHYNNQIPSNWRQAPIYGRGLHIKSEDRIRAEKTVKKLLTAFSNDNITNSLSHIYLFDHLCFKNIPFKFYYSNKLMFVCLGFYNDDNKMLFDMCYDLSIKYIKEHITNSVKERWAKLNTPKFVYTSDRFNECFLEETDVYDDGFLSKESRYLIETDIKIFTTYMFSDPEKLKILMGKYPVVKAKCNFIKEFLNSIRQSENI